MARKNDKQMEMLFEEGGIADDGMSVDPVSGNEVPAGSMASEVRDDVPAQLSEGEYVVPADVTRYYGVKFFEDLRSQAKMGLGEMEQDGRIGGEPVAVDEGSLTPEEEAVLNMAMGGMVEKKGYNEGGTVAGNVAPNYTMANYLFGTGGTGSFGTDTTATPDTTEDRAVTLYGPDGSTVSLVLPAQQTEYDNYIQQGYSETQDVVAQQTAAAFGGGDGDGGGDDPGRTGRTDSPSSVVSGFSDAPSYGTGLGVLGTTIAGGVVGGAFGGAGGMLKGAESAREAAQFNAARNDLVSAIQSNDMKAIAKAEADIRATFAELNKATKWAGVYTEGKTAEEAINNVREAVSMSRTTTGVGFDDNVPSYGAIPGSTSSAIGGGYQGPNLGTGTAGYNVVDPVNTQARAAAEARQQQAQASAQASLQRAREKAASDNRSSAAEEARETAARNEAAGRGAQSKAGSMAGTKSGYFDSPGGDSGGGGGDGKIVCTAMNNSYGFGSYRQAVWLRYSEKNLTEHHEKGYHRIFLPLVHKAYNSGDKNNLTLRKVLENIARHRTADLRAEMQGKKRDTVGRIYRSLLEPLCYIVGRFSKK